MNKEALKAKWDKLSLTIKENIEKLKTKRAATIHTDQKNQKK